MFKGHAYEYFLEKKFIEGAIRCSGDTYEDQLIEQPFE